MNLNIFSTNVFPQCINNVIQSNTYINKLQNKPEDP